MNAVQMAINRATREIPRMILEDCFVKRFASYRQSPVSLEQRIKEEVVLKMVIPDCNLQNGVWSYIPLINVPSEYLENYSRVYYVPKELTGGRSIQTVVGLSNTGPLGNGYSMAACENSMINQQTQNLLNSISNIDITSTARVDLIAENTIIVYDIPLMATVPWVIVILENDEYLSTLRPRSIPTFIRLIILAIKAYIYNEMTLEIDKGRLFGGHDLGRYREIIDSYADAHEQYQTLLDEKIGKIFFMNSKESMTRHIRFMLGGRR